MTAAMKLSTKCRNKSYHSKALEPCSKIKQARREGATTLTRTDVGDEILHISLLQ
jgi:hypothetical protein